MALKKQVGNFFYKFMNSLNKLFSIIKIGYLTRRNEVKIVNNKLNINLLLKLQKLGFIRGFNSYSNKKLLVYLKYYNNCPVFNNFYNIIKPTSKRNFSFLKINKIFYKNHLLSLFSADCGFITEYESLILRKGGFLIFTI